MFTQSYVNTWHSLLVVLEHNAPSVCFFIVVFHFIELECLETFSLPCYK